GELLPLSIPHTSREDCSMRIESGRITKLHVVHLNPGDDVLLGLREAVAAKGIRHAAIVGAIGSVTSYHFHVVASPDLPPAELYPKAEGAYDIATMTGFVFDGRIHCHIIFSDERVAFGGH